MAMNFKLKGGVTVSESDLESLSKEAAKGNYPGTPGEWIVRPQGRPTLCEEDLVSITIKLPRSQRDALDKKAKGVNQSRSQFMREALSHALL